MLECQDDQYEFNTQFKSLPSMIDYYVPTDSGYILVWVLSNRTEFQFIKDGILYMRTVNRVYGPTGISRMANRWYREVLEGA